MVVGLFGRAWGRDDGGRERCKKRGGGTEWVTRPTGQA